MPTFLDRVRQTIARHAMLTQGETVGVAVSGGADSLCLLHVLLELRAEFGLNLAIIHIDHNLRGEQSQADAQFVLETAQQLSLPFHLRTLAPGRAGGNLEQEGRRARYRFFRELIHSGAVQKVALGHTQSDQAETVLFRLLRGSGSAGLAGIRPVTNFGIVRPLLSVTRAEVEDWLKERDVSWREDATNAELRFDRNRIRHLLLPELEAEWNSSIADTLAQTADWAYEEEQYWHIEIPRVLADRVRFEKSTAVMDVEWLNALPVAVARRVLREIVRRVKYDLLGVSFAHIEVIRLLATASEGSGRVQIAGIEVFRSFNWLRFVIRPGSGGKVARNWQVCVTAPGHYVVPPATIELEVIRSETAYNETVYNGDVNALDWERAGGPLVLRNWRPGDHYQSCRHIGPEKIKNLFQEHRVPSWERRDWPIITVGDAIVWVSRFGPAAHCAADAGSRTVLRIREIRKTSV